MRLPIGRRFISSAGFAIDSGSIRFNDDPLDSNRSAILKAIADHDIPLVVSGPNPRFPNGFTDLLAQRWNGCFRIVRADIFAREVKPTEISRRRRHDETRRLLLDFPGLILMSRFWPAAVGGRRENGFSCETTSSPRRSSDFYPWMWPWDGRPPCQVQRSWVGRKFGYIDVPDALSHGKFVLPQSGEPYDVVEGNTSNRMVSGIRSAPC